MTQKQENEFSGVVKNYLANKHGDISAVELSTDEHTEKINFPPHTAKTVMQKAAPGESVKVIYEEEKAKHGPEAKKPKLKLLAIISSIGDDLVIDHIKPQKQDKDASKEKLKMTGFELLKGKKGELVGIKSDKKLVHVHKEDQELGDIIKPDSNLEIEAIKRTDDGFVNKEEDVVYHFHKIIVDDKEYTTKK